MLQKLRNVLSSTDRVVIGVMSGTSLDGIDVVVAKLTGSESTLSWNVLGSHRVPYSAELAEEIRKNSIPVTSSVDTISLLNVRLAHAYADAIQGALIHSGHSIEDVDAIGCHGQTVYHEPNPTELAGKLIAATLQIGDPSVLANLLGCPVVGDFRLADLARGGQGAPLVPYFDFICFGSKSENRMALNLGGIANVTVIPAGSDRAGILAFDTGPANMVIDDLCRRLVDQAYDEGGKIAASGNADGGWVSELLEHPFYRQSPPKSTGRELFSASFVDSFLESGAKRGLSGADMIATATQLTVRSIADAYDRFVRPMVPVDRLIVSGGGVHNRSIMAGLGQLLDGIQINSISEFGINPDEKEALCFAVLAHETLNGVSTNVPSATGADRNTLLGKICIPG